MSPPFRKRRFVLLFDNGGVMGEVFCVWGGNVFFAECGCRTRFVGGGASRRNLGTRVGHHNHKSTSNSIATNRLYLTKHHTHCVISEQTPAAFRRTPKGRRQAESRHSSKVSSPNASRLQIGCEAVLCKALAPPNPTKTSPKSTRKKQSEPNLRSAKAGALGGSSGKVREVWRGRKPSTKEGFLPLQGLSTPPPDFFAEKT